MCEVVAPLDAKKRWAVCNTATPVVQILNGSRIVPSAGTMREEPPVSSSGFCPLRPDGREYGAIAVLHVADCDAVGQRLCWR